VSLRTSRSTATAGGTGAEARDRAQLVITAYDAGLVRPRNGA
jgi:hypothetical protein